jgi:hypothetical protein
MERLGGVGGAVKRQTVFQTAFQTAIATAV